MKTFKQQNKELIEFDKTFDCENFTHCVERAMLLLKNRENQTIEEGRKWPFHTESYRWNIEQAITHRPLGESMMSAAMNWVEKLEDSEKEFNNIT